MKHLSAIHERNVKDVYSGPEGDLWELVMGQQIHIGGLASSLGLASRAEIGAEMRGVDLCCCSGAGMRFLLRFRNVAHMVGVDFCEKVIAQGERRMRDEGLADRAEFVMADVCATGLPDQSFDFVWGEDAWCYVADKAALIAEAARLTAPGGIIAFTDWVEGPRAMTVEEAGRFMGFMKFPSLATVEDYSKLLEENGCEVQAAEDTTRFARHIELYINMLDLQLTYDALRIVNFNMGLMDAMGKEMGFMSWLAQQRKVIQGIFVAVKR